MHLLRGIQHPRLLANPRHVLFHSLHTDDEKTDPRKSFPLPVPVNRHLTGMTLYGHVTVIMIVNLHGTTSREILKGTDNAKQPWSNRTGSFNINSTSFRFSEFFVKHVDLYVSGWSARFQILKARFPDLNTSSSWDMRNLSGGLEPTWIFAPRMWMQYWYLPFLGISLKCEEPASNSLCYQQCGCCHAALFTEQLSWGF